MISRYIINFLAIALTFTVVVFVHELGHLVTAVKAGVKVKVFSLGFGKELIGFTRKGIRYRISAIPFGGYVTMKGQDPSDEDAREKGALMALSPFKRIGVLFSGAGMNFLTGAVLFSALIFFTGMMQVVDKAVVGDVFEGKPAYTAGIKSGDRILEIDGEPVDTWTDLTDIISSKEEKPVEFKIERGGSVKRMQITPHIDPSAGRAMIGIAPGFETVKAGPLESVVSGFAFTGILSWNIIESVYLMITGRMEADIAGPIGIGMHISEAARYGIDRLLWLIALISVNLGLINLFPIPVLDGGHIMFALAEKVKGSPLKTKTIQTANLIGLVILGMLIAYVIWSDMLSIFTGGR